MDSTPSLAPSTLSKQADSDQQLIELWLHGKAQTTQQGYALEARQLLDALGIPLPLVKLSDLQGYLNSLTHLAPASQARSTNAIKSLFTFGHRIGYLQWNVAAPLKAPKVKNKLAERILSELDVQCMIRLEKDIRNQIMLKLLYTAGLRVRV